MPISLTDGSLVSICSDTTISGGATENIIRFHGRDALPVIQPSRNTKNTPQQSTVIGKM